MRKNRNNDKEKKRREPFGKIIKYNFFALKTVAKISPSFVIVKYFTDIINSVSIMLEHTFLVAYIISCAERETPFVNVLWFFVPLTSVICIRMVVQPSLNAWFDPKKIEKIKREINLRLYKKAVSMDISCYDDPEFYNDFVWAMHDAPEHVFGSIDTLSLYIQTIVTTLIVGIYMANVDAWGLVFVGGTLIFTLVMQMRANKLSMRLKEERKPAERRRDYINRVFYLADFVNDLKMSAMSEKLYEDFKKSGDELVKTEKKRSKKIVLLNSLSWMISDVLAFDGAYITYLLYQALYLHSMGYGELVALYNASYRLRGSLQRLVRVAPDFQVHSLYLEKMAAFLNKENTLPDDGRLSVPESGGISLRNVSFTYPGAEAETLHNISLDIKPGERIALVGYNGAGKSTLIKLLLRLYDPTDGVISYAGADIREYPLTELRERFSAVFQDYELFAATLGENITMSTGELDRERCLEVFRRVGFEECYNKLKNGFDTQLTHEFDKDGSDFSGGEAQKIAISRVLYSDSNTLVLDEPSSALDPISEYKLNHTILELAGNKTVIIISHRLSTTRMVDRIYMLEDGQIIESGTHDELIGKDGKYAEMFNLQAQNYRS